MVGNPEAGILVGSKARNPQRMVDFIDWLYSPEGIRTQWFAMPADSGDIATMRSQVEKVVKEYSWKAIYADSPEEFASIIKEMRESAVEFGYDEVVAVDMQNAADLKTAREEVMK